MTASGAGDVVLRPLERRHLAATLEWTNDRQLARLLDRAARVEADEHQRWFNALAGRSDTVYFAIEAGGRHIGNVWLANIDARHRKAEVRIVLATDAVGRGAGTEALREITTYAFVTLDLQRLYAYVLAFNPRARRSFEKAGFELEGTLRNDRMDGSTPVDVYVLGRLRNNSLH
jgi:RimJ/RimL family protein N-acetyltransferase